MKETDILKHNSIFAWIGLGTALMLLIPLVAMQVTREVNWSAGDFMAMGVLIFATGSGFVLLSRNRNRNGRILVGLLSVAVFVYLWAELAVGIFFNLGS